MDDAYRLAEKKRAIIVCMDESFDEIFVHLEHRPPYSYFFIDENAMVQDGFGSTAGKGE